MSEPPAAANGSAAPRPVGAVARAWADALEQRGYEHHVEGGDGLERWRRAPRAWRDILRHTGLQAPARVLEAGCGGGKQLAFLALNDFDVTGIDASDAVLARARRFVRELDERAGYRLPIRLVLADFLQHAPSADEPGFDLVFNFGVVEHFLDDEERAQFMRRQIDWCRPGGHSVHVVPSGIHRARARMRAEGLGGYLVPEVDFSPATLTAELEAAGGTDVRIFPANLLGQLRILPGSAATTAARRAAWLAAQAVPRRSSPLLLARAATFVAISRRPGAPPTTRR